MLVLLVIWTGKSMVLLIMRSSTKKRWGYILDFEMMNVEVQMSEAKVPDWFVSGARISHLKCDVETREQGFEIWEWGPLTRLHAFIESETHFQVLPDLHVLNIGQGSKILNDLDFNIELRWNKISKLIHFQVPAFTHRIDIEQGTGGFWIRSKCHRHRGTDILKFPNSHSSSSTSLNIETRNRMN